MTRVDYAVLCGCGTLYWMYADTECPKCGDANPDCQRRHTLLTGMLALQADAKRRAGDDQ